MTDKVVVRDGFYGLRIDEYKCEEDPQNLWFRAGERAARDAHHQVSAPLSLWVKLAHEILAYDIKRRMMEGE